MTKTEGYWIVCPASGQRDGVVFADGRGGYYHVGHNARFLEKEHPEMIWRGPVIMGAYASCEDE